MDELYPDPVKALCAGVHDVALSPIHLRKSSLDWAFELSQDSVVSDNSAATPSSFDTISTTATGEFEESQRALEYDGDDEGSNLGGPVDKSGRPR